MDESSRLCTRCGLCCDGRLFDYAKIAEGEEPAIRAAGLEIVRGDDCERNFRLPCKFLSDGCCTRYETRFHVCRSFRCELLRAVQMGSVGLATALATVDEAKRLLARAERHLEGPATRPMRRAKMRQLRELQSTTDGPEREAQARARLDLMTAKLFLERHFHRRREEEPKARLPGTEGIG
jgi:hypothetical protein